ncbi:uncharacterized protein RCC_10848 [Ramularia collo-cygni]|uniref:Uncharacterized protein n=1 Tax=Ramularia collo-cygni TaxID=112498 RepID=A0A2D3VMN0_9PEZI|nr:uncharacterized protein RCC_10848 [Ramularia collo-cygni]CZT25119.1 uncharacterized protein RCC_10848 [Ramularia collo-cygni]
MDNSLCLCFPCLIFYLGGYIPSRSEDQFYPTLENKGFSASDKKAIAEEWYWVSFERETAVKDYLEGYVTFTDGCWWRPPPRPPMRAPPSQLPQHPPGDSSRRRPGSRARRASSVASTEASSSSGPSV